MERQSESAHLDRRTVILLGLAGASAVALGKGNRVMAQEGVEIKVVTDTPSMIPGFGKVQLREFMFQPGGRTAMNAMKNPMVCECSLGSLEVIQDGKTFTANKGFVWTCNTGTMEQSVNKGTTPAVMRVFDFLSA